ncbi:tetratricopeptide repeat protein [candidate division KSB1 bacterium]|nr:tetratricopeptide repeat protein [candidate division KSB1 bacterium]
MKIRLFILLGIILLLISNCEQSSERRKIKLSRENTSSTPNNQSITTLHLDSQERRSIAVMFFNNETGDNNLAWLQKGLSEMFIRALSQSRSLSVLSSDRLLEILRRLEQAENAYKTIDMEIAAVVAREANVEAILTGNITRNKGDSLQINVQIHHPSQGLLLTEQSIEGPGLEKIFSMVDELSVAIRHDLQLTMDKGDTQRSIGDLSTWSIEAWRAYTTGVELSDKMMNQEAVQEFEHALELDSTFIAAQLELYRSLTLQAEITRAEAIFNKLQTLKQRASPKEKYQIELIEASRNTDINAVLEINSNWLNEFPDDRDANFTMASILYNIHNYHHAIPYFEQALKIDPKNKMGINQLGYTYARIGQYEKAISTLQTYQKIAPNEPNPYDSMGEIYWYFGEFAKAEQQYQKALQINNKFHLSMGHLGNIYMDNGDIEKAASAFREYHDMVESDVLKYRALYSQGLVEWRRGNKNLAIDLLKQSLEGCNPRYMVINQISQMYCERGDSLVGRQFVSEQYDHIYKALNDTYTTDSELIDLALISIFYKIKAERSISLMEQRLRQSNVLQSQMRLNFLLSILYIQTNQPDRLTFTLKPSAAKPHVKRSRRWRDEM